MKNYYPKLEFGNYYHIYNRGINGTDLFREKTNYEHFLKLIDKYIIPIADIYAWILMKNHFHMLIRIRNEEEFLVGAGGNPASVLKKPHLYFSHLFNSYTQAFNKKYRRHGSLFERPFRRIHVDDEEYLNNLVVYIHRNPFKSGWVNGISEYPWSSYNTLITEKPTILSRQVVINWFDDVANFKAVHSEEPEDNEINNLLFDKP